MKKKKKIHVSVQTPVREKEGERARARVEMSAASDGMSVCVTGINLPRTVSPRGRNGFVFCRRGHNVAFYF